MRHTPAQMFLFFSTPIGAIIRLFYVSAKNREITLNQQTGFGWGKA